MKLFSKNMVRSAVGIAAAVASAFAYADTTDQTLDKIEVTGSSIKRIDAETPSPVQVITAEQLHESGYTTVSEVLRNVSANGQGTLSQSFSGAFAAGASGVALRGLTVGATLVLIDGHRSAPYPLSDDGQRSFVDISSIPFDAIERIEILKDGASAIYGSDAIAGVVNVILKKSFTGTRLNAETGITSHHDGATQHVSITSGFGDFAADGHNGYISAEYRHQNQIRLIDRPGQLTLRDYTPYGGVNATPGVANANNGGYIGTLGGYTIDPNGVVTQLNGCTATNAYGPNCPFPLNGFSQLQPNTKNFNLLGKFNQSLGGDWKVSVDASWFSSSAEQVSGYSGISFGSYGIAAGPTQSIPSVYPSTGPVAAIGSDGSQLFTTFTGIPNGRNAVETDTYRLITTVSGTKFGWNLDATAGFNKAILHSSVYGTVSIPGLQSLLAANSSLTAAQLNAVLQDPANANTLSPVQAANSSSEIDYLTLRADRELATLPNGGSINLAVGAEYTHHNLNALAPTGIANGQVAGNDAFAVGTQNIASAYAELDTLITRHLEVDLAGRYDHVDTYGSSTTPKVGIKYQPVKQVALRGTYSKGFRAPNPAESGNAGQAFLYAGGIADPVLCANFPSQCNLTPTFYQLSNPNLQPETSTSHTLGFVIEPVKNYSISADYYKITLNNQITSAINVEPYTSLIPNAVRLPTPTTLLNNQGVPTSTGIGLIAYIPTPYINANTVTTSGVDIELKAMWDLHAYGKLSTDLNMTRVFSYLLTSPGVGTVQLAGTHGPSGIGGDTATPQNRAVWNISWDQGPWNVTTNINYISGYSVIDPASGLNNCHDALDYAYTGDFTGSSNPTGGVCRVASFTTFDLTGAYKVSNKLSLHGAITNLFNRQAPLDLETYGGSNYNPSLHQAGAVGRFFNVGVTYDF